MINARKKQLSNLKGLKFQQKRYHFRWVFAFNRECFYCWN